VIYESGLEFRFFVFESSKTVID